MENKLSLEYLQAIKEAEIVLESMSFTKHSFIKKGYAYFVQFIKRDTIVEFIIGPSDFHVDMIIFTEMGKFSFGDLMMIPNISKWVDENRYTQVGGNRNIKDELMWLIELMRTSLGEIK